MPVFAPIFGKFSRCQPMPRIGYWYSEFITSTLGNGMGLVFFGAKQSLTPVPNRPVQMKQFELSFKFAGYQQIVLVVELRGEEANQYTLHPKDEALLQKYGSQIVHMYHHTDRPAVFPVNKEEEKAFWGAIGDSLHQKLQPTGS
jgi:hypothetical protein